VVRKNALSQEAKIRAFKFRIAISIAILATSVVLSKANAQTQNCVISGGTNFGTIIQNCAPSPQIVPVKPAIGQPIIPIDGPKAGTFVYQVFAKVIGPTDIRVIACGDDVTDVQGSPWPAGMVSVTPLAGGPPHCMAKQLNQASSGTWVFQATATSKDKPVEIQAAIGDFNKPP
jgi:hypothetical protein